MNILSTRQELLYGLPGRAVPVSQGGGHRPAEAGYGGGINVPQTGHRPGKVSDSGSDR